VVRAHYAAFNARNATALLDLCAEDVKWFSVVGDRTNVDLQGRARLQEWLANYFASRPAARSEIADLKQTGPIVLVRETASVPESDGQMRRQSAFGLFEVRGGKIARVWYYPAQREAAP
jgi:ketosteroid isomerase-like protein